MTGDAATPQGHQGAPQQGPHLPGWSLSPSTWLGVLAKELLVLLLKIQFLGVVIVGLATDLCPHHCCRTRSSKGRRRDLEPSRLLLTLPLPGDLPGWRLRESARYDDDGGRREGGRRGCSPGVVLRARRCPRKLNGSYRQDSLSFRGHATPRLPQGASPKKP